MSGYWLVKPSGLETRREIVAFRNSKELRQVAPLWSGKPVQLTAQLSDGSAPAVTQSASDLKNNFQCVVTVSYRAATPCQLILDWTAQSSDGFVHLQAVTLE